MTTPDLSLPHATPERSPMQRFEALSRANHIRSYRSEMKRECKRGERDLLEVLQDPPAEVATMKVFDLLLSAPKYGRVKTNKVLGRCKISPSKTVGGLSERQRRELVVMMRRQSPYAMDTR